MADHFEEAKDAILMRTDANGGPTSRDLLNALGALAKDVDEAVEGLDKRQGERHDSTIGEVREICARVGRMENWRVDMDLARESCPAEVEAAIERGVEEAVERATCTHDVKHDAFVEQLEERFAQKRRTDDPMDDDWSDKRSGIHTSADRQVWLMWMVGSKLGYVLLAVLIAVSTWAVRWAITGSP